MSLKMCESRALPRKMCENSGEVTSPGIIPYLLGDVLPRPDFIRKLQAFSSETQFDSEILAKLDWQILAKLDWWGVGVGAGGWGLRGNLHSERPRLPPLHSPKQSHSKPDPTRKDMKEFSAEEIHQVREAAYKAEIPGMANETVQYILLWPGCPLINLCPHQINTQMSQKLS